MMIRVEFLGVDRNLLHSYEHVLDADPVSALAAAVSDFESNIGPLFDVVSIEIQAK